MATSLHRRFVSSIALLAVAGMALTACSSDPVQSPIDQSSSFGALQAKVLSTSCATAGCHVAGSAYAVESGLVLEPSVAYENLVGAQPKNAQARGDGMLRVRAGDTGRSFLWHKLTMWNGHQHGNYGSPMPLGGRILSNGQLEFIARWILAGAPRTGVVADASLLDDTTRQTTAPFTPLAPPARGVQLAIEPFQVQPFFERELFVYRKLNNAEEIYVNRIETKMRANSHHLLALTFDPSTPFWVIPQFDVVRDIRNPDGSAHRINQQSMPYHVYFAGAMTPTSDYSFPPGVALELPANAALDMNSHYVNRGASPITGEAYMNLHTVDRSQVRHVARTLNLPHMNFTLPPHQRTTVTRSFIGSSTINVFMLTSHMHERGERFTIKIKGGPRDGEIVYENTDWGHPLIKTFDTPLVLNAGEGLTSEVVYNNTTARTIRFGLTSEDEMDIIFGYFW